MIEPVDGPHVVLLLQRDIDNRVRDFFADAVQKLGFTDDHLQSGVEVYEEFFLVAFTYGNQDVFRQVVNCSLDVLSLPPLEHLKFVGFCQQFGGLDVISRGTFAVILADKDVRLGLELVNRRLNARND